MGGSTAVPSVDRVLNALHTFEDNISHRSVWMEVDVMALADADALLNRSIRVFWPDENKWFQGNIERYDERTGTHFIHYDDGENEEIVLATERVRLPLPVTRPLPQPTPAALQSYCNVLRTRAKSLAARGDTKKARILSTRLAGITATATRPPLPPPPTYYHPGDVVWAKTSGYSFWPAIITTYDHHYKGPFKFTTPHSSSHRKKDKPQKRDGAHVSVTYFAEYSIDVLKLSNIIPVKQGIEQGFMAPPPPPQRPP